MDALIKDALDAAALRREQVTTSRGVSTTEYRVRGSLASIFDFIARLLADKHPAGYGTRVHSIEWDAGQYVARVSHSNSAD